MRRDRIDPSSVTACAVPPSPQGEGLKAEERQKRVAGKSAADDMEVHIRLDKQRGSNTGTCLIEAETEAEKLYGLAVLVRHLGRTSGVGTEGVLARLATVLLTANGPERTNVGIGPYDERSGGDGQD